MKHVEGARWVLTCNCRGLFQNRLNSKLWMRGTKASKQAAGVCLHARGKCNLKKAHTNGVASSNHLDSFLRCRAECFAYAKRRRYCVEENQGKVWARPLCEGRWLAKLVGTQHRSEVTQFSNSGEKYEQILVLLSIGGGHPQVRHTNTCAYFFFD